MSRTDLQGAASVVIWERLLWFQRQAVREMDGHLQARFGQPLDAYDVLHQVARHGAPLRMGDLAERLLVAHSSCNRIVGRLVDSGHLTRRPGEVDRREVLVDLTPTGRALHRRMAAVHTRDIQRLVDATLPPEARLALDAALPPLA